MLFAIYSRKTTSKLPLKQEEANQAGWGAPQILGEAPLYTPQNKSINHHSLTESFPLVAGHLFLNYANSPDPHQKVGWLLR